MNEHQPSTEPFEGLTTDDQDTGQQTERLKTLAVRLDEGLHAQLRFIAQLSGSSLTDEIRRAIEARITTAQDDPDLIARAHTVREEIEREAAARAAAIAGFLGRPAVADTITETPTTTSTPRRSRQPRQGSK